MIDRTMRRILFLMPEFTLGGAEKQMHMILECLSEHNQAVDIYLEHMQDEDMVPSLKKSLKGISIFEYHEANSNSYERKTNIDRFIRMRTRYISYSVCFLYAPYDLERVEVLKTHGISCVFSERNDGSNIFSFPERIDGLKKCDYVTCNSTWAKNQIKEKTGLDAEVINNGKPVMSQLPLTKTDIKRIVVPARIARYKNQGLLVDWAIMQHAYKGEVFFAGRIIDGHYAKAIVTKAKRSWACDRLSFLGEISNMRDIYADADLVVLPSYSEGTPNVVLEAFMLGRPVIVSDIGPERELVEDSKLRFSPNNVKELDACIRNIQRMSDDKYINMIERNRQFVLEKYNVERMANRYCEIFEKLRENSIDEVGAYKSANNGNLWMEVTDINGEPTKTESGAGVQKATVITRMLDRWLWIRQIGKNLEQYLVDKGIKSIAIYGVGVLGERLLDELLYSQVEVMYGIDRKAEHKKLIIPVYAEMKRDICVDAIVVTVATEYIEVKEKLMKEIVREIPILWIKNILDSDYWFIDRYAR